MKTAELVDKYARLIGGLLNLDPKLVRFYIKPSSDRPDDFPVGTTYRKPLPAIREIGVDYEVAYTKPDEAEDTYQVSTDWGLGEYTVGANGAVISTFKLYQMPHCCGIVVFCNAFVSELVRHRRVGTTLNMMRQDIGRMLGFSFALCTDIAKNVHQRQLLATNGWQDFKSFVNQRTKNEVYIAGVDL